MKRLPLIAVAVAVVLSWALSACGGSDSDRAEAFTQPELSLSFVNAVSDDNTRKADSLYSLLDSLSPVNKAYMALYYYRAMSSDFENSATYARRAMEAYDAARAENSDAVEQVFADFNKEYGLGEDGVTTAFTELRLITAELTEAPVPDVAGETIVDEPLDSVAPATTADSSLTIDEAVLSVQ